MLLLTEPVDPKAFLTGILGETLTPLVVVVVVEVVDDDEAAAPEVGERRDGEVGPCFPPPLPPPRLCCEAVRAFPGENIPCNEEMEE